MKKCVVLWLVLLVILHEVSSQYFTKPYFESEIRRIYKDQAITLHEVERYSAEKFFYNTSLYEIRFITRGVRTKRVILPDGGNLAVFAEYEGKFDLLEGNPVLLAYLVTKYSNESVIQKDQRGFVKFICQMLTEKRNETIIPVVNYEDINNIKYLGIVYPVRTEIRDKYEGTTFPIEINSMGRSMTFYILSGWMHEIHELHEIRIRLGNAREGYILERNVIEKEVYSEIPSIKY